MFEGSHRSHQKDAGFIILMREELALTIDNALHYPGNTVSWMGFGNMQVTRNPAMRENEALTCCLHVYRLGKGRS